MWCALILISGAGCVQTAEKPPSGTASPAIARIGERPDQLTALVEIVSRPRDGMVVVNRQPVGLAPRTLEVPVTSQGFMADPITIAVRFVARDVTEASMTSSVTLHPTDRAPVRLEFERENVKRVFR